MKSCPSCGTPIPGTWDSSDSREATEFRQRILDALMDGRDDHVQELLREMNSGSQEFALVVWALLPSAIRRQLKYLQ